MKILYQKWPKCVEVNVLKELPFREKFHKNKYICKFIPSLVHEILVWALFQANFGLMMSPSWVKTSKFWENGFINKQFISKFLLLLTFVFLSTLILEILMFELFDPLLGWWCHHGVSKLQNFESSFKTEYFTSIFPLLMSFIFLSPLVHEIQVWALFDPILG